MEIEFTKKQLEELIEENEEIILKIILKNKDYMNNLIELSVGSEIDCLYSSEHLDNIMEFIERHDEEYRESCGVSTELFWKSLPSPDSFEFINKEDPDYILGIDIFNEAIKEIEEKKEKFINDALLDYSTLLDI